MSWESIDKSRPDSMHYSIAKPLAGTDTMQSLREMFDDGEADELNFVLFSTSGVHGTYATIEDVEQGICDSVTFLVVHPRLVGLRYGNVEPKTADDFAFLKKLRGSSWDIVTNIGEHE